ncbi:MAG: hypothetical protein QOE31_779, partial [Solirubrobacteraceae bacterium]|nr:hypothetical protein [Solirubrobacteraceae bacterium]
MVQGPTFIGLRQSRWAKSMMVAGVVAVVAGYASPPIAAAAGGGSTAGLPGLQSPSFAFPVFDEPRPAAPQAAEPQADAPAAQPAEAAPSASPAAAQSAAGATASAAQGTAAAVDTPAAPTSASVPAAAPQVVVNSYDNEPAPAKHDDTFDGLPVVEDVRGAAPVMSATDDASGHAQQADRADEGFVGSSQSDGTRRHVAADPGGAVARKSTSAGTAALAAGARTRAVGGSQSEAAAPAPVSAEAQAPAPTPAVASAPAAANVAAPLEAAAPAPAEAAAPAPAPAAPASGADAAAPDAAPAALAAPESPAVAAAAPAAPAEDVAVETIAAETAAPAPAPVEAVAPEPAAAEAVAPDAGDATAATPDLGVTIDAAAASALNLEPATSPVEPAAAPALAPDAPAIAATMTLQAVAPVAPPAPPAVSAELLSLTGATLSELAVAQDSAPQITSSGDAAAPRPGGAAPAALADANAFDGDWSSVASATPQLASASDAPADVAATGPYAGGAAIAPAPAAGNGSPGADLYDEPPASDPGESDGLDPPAPTLTATADGDPAMARGPPSQDPDAQPSIDGHADNALISASAATGTTSTAVMDQATLASLIDDALAWWGERIGATPVELTAAVTDLPGLLLGDFQPGIIRLDTNAAGYGWFVPGSPTLTGAMNALTAVRHEVGHALGLDHSSATLHPVMADTLAPIDGPWLLALTEAAARSISVTVEGTDLAVTVNGVKTTRTIASLSALRITSSDAQDDALTIDLSAGAIELPISFDGNGGSNSVTVDAPHAAWTWTGTSGAVTGAVLLTFSGVQRVTAEGADDALTGPAGGGSWTVDATGAGSVAGLSFSGFERLAGGAGADTLRGPDATTSWTINGNGAGLVAGLGFYGFEALSGGSGADTLTGPVLFTSAGAGAGSA